MSSQLEFIMQLYMMNLLQQQQQQQQHQQQQQQHQLQQQQQQQYFPQSPVKQQELRIPQPQQSLNLRTHTRKNSQNTQCSSHSRSSSPNSNSSPLPITSNTTTLNTLPQTPQAFTSSSSFNPLNLSPILTATTTAQAPPAPPPQQPMTQMLLNNLPPLTQFMLMQQLQQQQQQQQQQITTSNLLLTPTTPNSQNSQSACFSTPLADSCSSTQTHLNMAGYLANSGLVNPCAAAGLAPVSITAPLSVSSSSASASPSSASALFFPSTSSTSAFPVQNPFIAATNTTSSQHNFLQSSTVTSTPCSDSILADKSATTINLASSNVSAVGLEHSDVETGADDDDDVICKPKLEPIEIINLSDEDAQVYSSLHSSSGNSGANSGNNSKLMCSGVMALETTSDSLEDLAQLPYTPEKSFSLNNPSTSTSGSLLTSLKDNLITAADVEQTTPVTLKNAILTPPSSEQLSSGQTFEAMCGAQNPSSGALGATCASGVDSFLTEENLKHLRKNSSYLECGNSLCRQENLREHFHCFEEPCQGKILSKKDDIIRHLKWHKKRKESLLLGFARFSSSDDCAPEYGAGCAHNWKQTHYHCIYEDCPKVYVSTSDVQMHANFHRKNSEIVQEGFRRFRAHENCKIEECPFYGKKTSHYHCCREGCNHTFKNKADMDKHKTYHMKDHQLIQDGFKKILKTEQCPFEDCKFSTVSNHIHCVREGCNFILHSSTQMISHKRKHDRAEGEQNYQQFKRDSSEEESPKPVVKAVAVKPERRTSSSSTSTPLSSLSAEHFLARKRGRPPKKIQLPSESQDTKRIKLETSTAPKTATYVPPKAATLSMINPFMPGYQTPATTDPNAAPNMQLTHLMALFQLQNPLFYQNLYPHGRSAAAANNMANILDNAGESGSTSPATTTASSNIKQDFSDKSEFKE